MSDIQIFARSVYEEGQEELDKRTHRDNHADKRALTSPHELTVLSCAACIDLMFWALREESGIYLL